MDYKVSDAIIVHSIDELLEELKKYPTEDVYIIGGDSVYAQMLPYCDTVYATNIERSYEADTYFPNLDKLDEWSVEEESEEQTYFDLEYVFRTYKKNK